MVHSRFGGISIGFSKPVKVNGSLVHFLQAGGDCRAFQPSFADEGFALRLDLLLRVGVDHPRRFPHAPVIADDLQFF